MPIGSGRFDAYGKASAKDGSLELSGVLSAESRMSKRWAGFLQAEATARRSQGITELEAAAMIGLRARW